jgi:single-stranded DNA-specific DHH superfamily exonuclease
MITPRINAASRMGKPDDAFKLLVAETAAIHHIWLNFAKKNFLLFLLDLKMILFPICQL